MSDEATKQNPKIGRCVTQILIAYLSKNRIPRSELPALITSMVNAVAAIAGYRSSSLLNPIVKPTEAEIERSIHRDRLISFIDGKPYQMLERHLTLNGHTAESYRSRYGLPIDYPMVAPSYSERRTELSKQNSERQRQLAAERTLH